MDQHKVLPWDAAKVANKSPVKRPQAGVVLSAIGYVHMCECEWPAAERLYRQALQVASPANGSHVDVEPV